MFDPLEAMCTLDGRYRKNVAQLTAIVCEQNLFKLRIHIEVEYFIKVSPLFGFDPTPYASRLRKLVSGFSLDDARAVKKIEADTNHDVKACEYWLRQKAAEMGMPAAMLELFHIALTSEDVNNLAYSLMAHEAQALLIEVFGQVFDVLDDFAEKHAETLMPARTHGQLASPTSFGKEMRVFANRLSDALINIEICALPGKLNGATGTYAAHLIALPDVNWREFSQDFVESLGLKYQAVTTQIESHDRLAEYLDSFKRANTLLTDLAQDMWLYIAFDIVALRHVDGETGSSTMPQKVNPIDFENAFGNFLLSTALLECLSRNLPISKMQRDLSDSTLIRNVGLALGFSLQALTALLKGLGKIGPNHTEMERVLDAHPEVLAEAIQTVLRAEGIPNGYELLKEFTRGRSVTYDDLEKFIETLPLSEGRKEQLKALRPRDYVGLAADLARD